MHSSGLHFTEKLDLTKQAVNRGAKSHANNEVALQMACQNGKWMWVVYLVN